MFKKTTTTNASDATILFLQEAAQDVPVIIKREVISEFDDMKRVWGSKKLFEGDAKSLENLVRANFEEIAKLDSFENFVIQVIEDQKCAQVSAILSGSFIGTRLWRSKGSFFSFEKYKLYICGNSAFHEIS